MSEVEGLSSFALISVFDSVGATITPSIWDPAFTTFDLSPHLQSSPIDK